MRTKILIVIIVIGASLLSVDIFLTNHLINSQQHHKRTNWTLAIIKPDATLAKSTGKIIDRIEQEGFEIKKLKKMHLEQQQAKNFYLIHKNKSFYESLVKYMTSGPIIVMVLEKEKAIEEWRNLMGSTNPEKAASNTLRKLYGTNIERNAVHGSDSAQSAKSEIHFFFPYLI